MDNPEAALEKVLKAKQLFEKNQDCFTVEAINKNSKLFREISDLIDDTGMGQVVGHYMAKHLIAMIEKSKRDQQEMADKMIVAGWEKFTKEYKVNERDLKEFQRFKREFFLFLFNLIKILS